MNILCSFLGQRPVLAAWEKRPFSPGVLDGPRASDNHDRHAVKNGMVHGPANRSQGTLDGGVFNPKSTGDIFVLDVDHDESAAGGDVGHQGLLGWGSPILRAHGYLDEWLK